MVLRDLQHTRFFGYLYRLDKKLLLPEDMASFMIEIRKEMELSLIHI